MSNTCHTHVIHIVFGHARLCSVMGACVTCCSGQAFVHAWLDPGVLLLPGQLGGRPWQADRCGPRRPLWHASWPCLAGTLRRRTGWDVAQASGQRVQAYTWPHVIHLSNRMPNTCQTHVIHVPYTWDIHGVHIVFGYALSRSVILGHGCCWPLGM